MIKVLEVVHSLDVGGIETFVASIQDHVDQREFEVIYLCIGSPGRQIGRAEARIIEKRGTVHWLPCLSLKIGSYQPSSLRRLALFLDGTKPDVVHIHVDGADLVAWMARKRNIPVIRHSHNTRFSKPSGRVRSVIKPLAFRAVRMIVSSGESMRLACSQNAGEFLFGKAAFEVIPNGIDLNRFSFDAERRSRTRRDLGVESSEILLLNIGRCANQKNQWFALEIAAELACRKIEGSLVVVGDGPLIGELQAYAAQLGLDPDKVFLGARDDVADLYSAADVFLLTSLYEGFPISLVEAQANGLVCIVPDNVSKEVDLTGQVMFLPLADGVAKWVDTIGGMSRSRQLANLGGALQSYDFVSVIRRLEDIYRDVTKEPMI